MKRKLIFCFLYLFIASSTYAYDALPSWNDNDAKERILDFVQDVTTPDSDHFVPVEGRVAVFDNDGTLWCEAPDYTPVVFFHQRVREFANKNPHWKLEQPYKSTYENDKLAMAAHGHDVVKKVLEETYKGMSPDELTAVIEKWLGTAQHPRFKKIYPDLIYQPMLELMDYLRAKKFKIYIVSGAHIEFLRALGKVYDVPYENLIGSILNTEYEVKNGKPQVSLISGKSIGNTGCEKPTSIQAVIGRRPIFAFGNSDGDYEMLEWTTSGSGKTLGLIVHHDDSVREYAYDRESSVGRLDRALDKASEKDWEVVSMKDDWKVIFPEYSRWPVTPKK